MLHINEVCWLILIITDEDLSVSLIIRSKEYVLYKIMYYHNSLNLITKIIDKR